MASQNTPTQSHTNPSDPSELPPSSPLPPTPSEIQPPLYLIRLSQTHESFRLPELHSLATYFKIPLKIHEYSPSSPFCIVSFPLPTTSTSTYDLNTTHALAKLLISRSILSKGIYHLYASATSYTNLHDNVRRLPGSTWTEFENVSFKFSVDAYKGKRSVDQQREIVESFGYLPLKGRIRMKGAEEEFVVLEEWVGGNPNGNDAVEGDGLSAATGATVYTDITTSLDTSITTNPPGTLNPSPTFPSTPTQPGHPIPPALTTIHFTRHISPSQRPLIEKHDLKKRPYISTTSMDAELALLTALMAHAGPGRLVLDPFVGTGGFMVAAAELGAITLGADIDGRSFKGKEMTGKGGKRGEMGVMRNFRRYGIESGFGDCVTGDLTNSMWRMRGRGRGKRWLDAVICDPPYGVREGLKVLGRRGGNEIVNGNVESESEVDAVTSSRVNGDNSVTDTETRSPHQAQSQPQPPPSKRGPILINGIPSHTLPGFIAPKRPYSFNAMLLDILDFAARTLVTGGRLAFWMPCANEATEEEFPIPKDPKGLLVLKHVCVQGFNRWSRRLLVYERGVGEVEDDGGSGGSRGNVGGKAGVNGGRSGIGHADDLNQFRRMYFRGFDKAVVSGGSENA